ncbi:hypothetical protein CDD81_4635 [Ophiocordyceps australis]|uniref:H/ACA ribonucleoprotein complex non-core subunit NAF1 n=1 Tax=Ophiocordyceps australis TaxID=1399860 RepID=A0A2C5YBS4_9HYPO|nr:hypothetical protein CDD81_4635 [Ophiocordyceps australis]
MAGFSIPGLGLAKSNEVLPRLPSASSAATNSTVPLGDQKTHNQAPSLEAMKEEQSEHTDQHDGPLQDTPMEDVQVDNGGQDEVANQAQESDSVMADHQPSSPASITFALEAALGGLSDAISTQDQAKVLAEQTQESVETAPSDEQKPAEHQLELPSETQEILQQIEDEAAAPVQHVQQGRNPEALGSQTVAASWTAAEALLGPVHQTAWQEATELQNDTGENAVWEMDSSPYESSSDSSSSDSSDSDNEGYELLGVEETARLLMEAEAGSDDETDPCKGGKLPAARAARVRTRNEVAEAPPPRPDVVITPEMGMEELGAVVHIVEGVVVIKAVTPGEYQVLDTGSVLCTADRSVVGVVAETIGTVIQPMYTVRFAAESSDSDDDLVSALGLQVGTKLFYPVDLASYVFTQPLRNVKGSDASNMHDEEVGDDDLDFSDDEKEAEYKRSVKQQRSKNKSAKPDAPRPPHPLRQHTSADAGLNYDDTDAKPSNHADDDGPYRPLARPPGFGTQGPSTEFVEAAPRFGAHRGSQRRDHQRGRGARGRAVNRGSSRNASFNPPPREHVAPSPQGSQYPSQPQHPLPNHPFQPAYSAQQAASPLHPPLPPHLPGASLPNLGDIFIPPPGHPPLSHGAPAPPPPPPLPPQMGWPAPAQTPAPNGGTFLNPSLIAALMSQIQAGTGQQWSPPQQPPPGYGR